MPRAFHPICGRNWRRPCIRRCPPAFRPVMGEGVPVANLCWHSPCNLDRIRGNGRQNGPIPNEQAY